MSYIKILQIKNQINLNNVFSGKHLSVYIHVYVCVIYVYIYKENEKKFFSFF